MAARGVASGCGKRVVCEYYNGSTYYGGTSSLCSSGSASCKVWHTISCRGWSCCALLGWFWLFDPCRHTAPHHTSRTTPLASSSHRLLAPRPGAAASGPGRRGPPIARQGARRNTGGRVRSVHCGVQCVQCVQCGVASGRTWKRYSGRRKRSCPIEMTRPSGRVYSVGGCCATVAAAVSVGEAHGGWGWGGEGGASRRTCCIAAACLLGEAETECSLTEHTASKSSRASSCSGRSERSGRCGRCGSVESVRNGCPR